MEVDREHGAALAVVGAAPLAVWFLVGQLREGNGGDYIFRVPDMNRTAEVALGLFAAAVVASAAARLVGERDWLIHAGWWRVYVRLLAAGILLALGARVVTAASVGANIGGGFVLYFGPLPVLYLLERARYEARLLRSPDGAVGWTPSAFEWLTLALLVAFGLMMNVVRNSR